MRRSSFSAVGLAFAAAAIAPALAFSGGSAAGEDVPALPASGVVRLAQATPAPGPAEAALIPGEAETQTLCGSCHGTITSRRSDRLWDEIWSQMLAQGMPPQSRETRQIVLTYLKTYLSSERDPPVAP